MTVNSFEFPIFFLIVFVVYYLPFVRKTAKIQNTWLLLVSYGFYGMTDWKMLALLVGSTVLFYILGHHIKKQMERKCERCASIITTIGVLIGVGILVFFKYLDFFISSIAEMINLFGLNLSWSALHIILPVGVSFFTFKLISYIVEIYRQHIEPTSSVIDFAIYIAFFPTILSGPIDKPDKFIPQIQPPRIFDYPLAVDGCRQVLWGIMIKMCIADNLTAITDTAWGRIDSLPASTLIIAALLYPLQLYADFDGYSHMAIGVAKILGIKVERNFNHPLIARNMAEYWRRWHISLTSWITTYIFMPLNISFRNLGKLGIWLAAFINLVVIGLWHGANWTYVVFGIYHGLLFIPLVFSGAFGKNKKMRPVSFAIGKTSIELPGWTNCMKMLLTYCLVAIGHVIFRAPDIASVTDYMSAMVNFSSFSMPHLDIGVVAMALALLLPLLDWFCRKDEHPLQTLCKYMSNRRWMRWILYYLIIIIILRYQGRSAEFIYFQF